MSAASTTPGSCAAQVATQRLPSAYLLDPYDSFLIFLILTH